jgi:hypothetical protein
MKEVKKILLLVPAIAIVAMLAYFYLTYFSVDIEGLKTNVKNLYELSNPGSVAEVVALTETSGLYHAVIKITIGGNVNYAEAWVTKDGRLLTQSVIFVKESVNQMQKLKNFVDCLSDKGLRIYGILNQTASPQGAQATLIQLNILGLFSPKIFVNCDLNLQACLNAGISQVPSVVINNRIEPGVKSIPDLEKISGCKFG